MFTVKFFKTNPERYTLKSAARVEMRERYVLFDGTETTENVLIIDPLKQSFSKGLHTITEIHGYNEREELVLFERLQEFDAGCCYILNEKGKTIETLRWECDPQNDKEHWEMAKDYLKEIAA